MRYFCIYESKFMHNSIPCCGNALSLLIFIAMSIKYKQNCFQKIPQHQGQGRFVSELAVPSVKIKRLVKTYHCLRNCIFDFLHLLYFQLYLTFIVFQKLCQAVFVLSASSFKVKVKQTNKWWWKLLHSSDT